MSGTTAQGPIAEYFAECDEMVQKITASLAKIEKGEYDSSLIDDLYRSIHTLKGSSQLFGFTELGDLAHAIETCLDPIRHKKAAHPALLESLFRSVDLIEQIVRSAQKGETVSFRPQLESAIPSLVEVALTCFGADFTVVRDPAEVIVTDDLAADWKIAGPSEPVEQLPAESSPVGPSLMLEAAQVSVSPPSAPSSSASSGTDAPSGPSGGSSSPPDSPSSPGAASGDGAEGNSTIRVSVSLLDKLMTLVGEMVLVRNQVLQYSDKRDDLELLNLSQRLDIVTSELQGEVMKTRMQPIGNILSKFQRVVRDLARDLNKKIELHLVGTETELDKTLLEAVKDPLTHIVRNCSDHGIESPEERVQAGKSEKGRIEIHAFHEGGQVIVEIKDDGRGLRRDKILSKAIERGLTTTEKSNALSDREVQSFIFAPGFSTAAKVTSVSGRGVGMDVVKNNIERIGGQVELSSEAAKGMTVRIKIPLTLAIVPAMIIRSGQQRYAIPQVKLVELVRIEGDSTQDRVEQLQGKPVYRLRGNLLPLVNLREVFKTGNRDQIKDTATNIVVLSSEGNMFGLIVDEIQDTADIVVKPMNQFLKYLNMYSGATVLGDGSVSLILDVTGLSQLAALTAEHSAREVSNHEAERSRNTDQQEFLLFRVNAPGKYAVPLNLVQRLEEFPKSSIEYSGNQRVVRYRGAVMPLISLNGFLQFTHAERETPERINVIVVTKGGRSFGIEVNEILDVAVLEANIDDSLRDRPGILGNIIHQEQIVVIIDILHILQSESSRMSSKEQSPSSTDFANNRSSVKILFAEDTAFFRKHVSSVLTKAGFSIVGVNDGQEAFELLCKEGPHAFTAVLSDVEMPRMNGIELVKAIRKSGGFETLPVIALTTKFNDRHVQEGLAAGFSAYLEKMNPEELIHALDKWTSGKRSAA